MHLSVLLLLGVSEAFVQQQQPRRALRRMPLKAEAHGGSLVNLYLEDAGAKEAAIASCSKTIEVTERQSCDIELICNGGFSPLEGFMDEEAYTSVVSNP